MGAYIRCKHKKTGDERIYHEPVFRSVEHQYKFIQYVDNPDGKYKGSKAQTPTAQLAAVVQAATTPVVKASKASDESEPIDTVRESLANQYKALTGKDPDKRWGVPKLTEKIKEAEEQKG